MFKIKDMNTIKKKSFIVYFDALDDVLTLLSDAEIGIFFRTLREYQESGTIKKATPKLIIAVLQPFVRQYNRELEAYNKKVKRNQSIAIKRKEKRAEDEKIIKQVKDNGAKLVSNSKWNQVEPSGAKSIQVDPKHSYTDNDNDNVKDNDNDNVNDTVNDFILKNKSAQEKPPLMNLENRKNEGAIPNDAKQVEEYFLALENFIGDSKKESENFFDYYDAIGWVRGNSQIPIRKWKKVASSWAKKINQKTFGNDEKNINFDVKKYK